VAATPEAESAPPGLDGAERYVRVDAPDSYDTWCAR